ncbi:SPL family radical SAM protein [Methylobacterium platani]|uniref:Radical SAM protein n=2 Tax=Methylobacterium platani TaxID=427683 RepID=A0A179S4C6_9HYPH|nr:radical SAM protein [Methylobacterium platani]KMO13731.1 radical SAM protein [Methylobacterium platani JCM 14648]OAS20927.1 radical SAM protein [Methylobacterium platani]
MTLHDPAPARAARPWRPRRVVITAAAREHAHGRAIAARAAGLGLPVEDLSGNRLTGENLAGLRHPDPRRAYVEAKNTLAVVVAPPTKLKLQPIPPSADWRVDLAEGCPAHCQYCYLAGSLTGPPVTRVYANLDEILGNLAAYAGRGGVTSANAERVQEGTTFEASCYTDPLGIEHLTGSLSAAIRHFGAWDAPVTLRATTKFAAVEPLLGLPHGRRTRLRFSVNPPGAARYEGGTAPLRERLAAMGAVARAGYPVGITVAPILPLPDWREAYAALFCEAAAALEGAPDLDLTAELITHRFTPGSKAVLEGWYPGSDLPMREAERSRKLTKFGSVKYVFPAELMREMKQQLTRDLAERLPAARVLYWT